MIPVLPHSTMIPVLPHSIRPFPRLLPSFRVPNTTTVATMRRFPNKRRFRGPLKVPLDSPSLYAEEPSPLDDLTALTSSPSPDDYPADPIDSSTPKLRGSDVLLALQRAVRKKEKRQGEKKRGGNGKKPLRMRDSAEGLEEGEAEVRPIVVRKDWETRMDELEKKIKDLQQY